MKRMQATAMGFMPGVNCQRVRPGEIIEVPDDFKASWLVDLPTAPVQPEEAPAARRRRGAATLSELAKEPVTGPSVGEIPLA